MVNQKTTTTTTTTTHVALLASPGMGHLTPTIELGKRLLSSTYHHSCTFTVTIFVVTTDHSSTATSHILQQKTSNLDILIVPPVEDVSTKLGPNPNVGARIGLTMSESIPFIRSQILSMKLPPSALIVDLFGTAAFPMAREFHMSTYVFFASTAWFSAVTIYLPFLEKEAAEKHAYEQKPLFIPGCEPVQFEDTMEPFLSPSGPMFEGYKNVAEEILTADGILMNTWQDLETAATKAVRENEILGRFTKGSVYPIGPLVRSIEPTPKTDDDVRDDILSWLDKQPAKSVIFLSFGSGGTMSENQMRELAFGLEMSQQRFVWVVREPTLSGDACGAFFDTRKKGEKGTVVDYLPEGFLKRTEEVGICVPMWAPQAEILRHPATGGFVTHCGWNSVLESIVSGVPMVAWPLYAEQKMNAAMLSREEIGVAVRVKQGAGGVVCREEIAEVVRRVMVDEEGVVMRNKVKEVKVSGEKALSVFGSSHVSLCEFIKDCELHGTSELG